MTAILCFLLWTGSIQPGHTYTTGQINYYLESNATLYAIELSIPGEMQLLIAQYEDEAALVEVIDKDELP